MILTLRSEVVTEWFVAFYDKSTVRWLDRLLPSRFKHVSAFGFSHGAQTWIFYDVSLFYGTRITLAPAGSDGDRAVGLVTADACKVLKLSASSKRRRIGMSWLFFWCVPAARNLLNLGGGALLPDALWRDCIRAGARIVISHD